RRGSADGAAEGTDGDRPEAGIGVASGALAVGGADAPGDGAGAGASAGVGDVGSRGERPGGGAGAVAGRADGTGTCDDAAGPDGDGGHAGDRRETIHVPDGAIGGDAREAGCAAGAA